MGSGILTVAAAWLTPKFAIVVLLAGLALSSLLVVAYSYVVWKGDKARAK
jgi:hypothetical protein